MKVFIAGIGSSDGGHYSLEVFSNATDARDYVEDMLEDHPGEREWSTQPVIDHSPGEGLEANGEQLYYGFERYWKGFIKETEVKTEC